MTTKGVSNRATPSALAPPGLGLSLAYDDKFTSTLLDRQESRRPEKEFEMDKGIESRISPREMTLDQFRQKALPAIRIGKLKKMQALVRGWYTRKYILPLKRLNHYAAHRLVDRLMEEWVELHFLPEIILEIIQHNQAYRDYSFYSPEGKLIWELADSLQNSLVHKMCEEVVRDVTRSLVNQHLRTRQEAKIYDKDYLPPEQLATIYLTTASDLMLKPLVKEAIKELVDEYLVDVAWVKLLEFDFLPLEIAETIEDSGWEVAIEIVINDALDDLMMIYIMDVIVESVELEKIRLDEEATESAFQAMISRCILNAALEEAMKLDDILRMEAEANRGDEELSRVEEEELDEFSMDPSSKFAPGGRVRGNMDKSMSQKPGDRSSPDAGSLGKSSNRKGESRSGNSPFPEKPGHSSSNRGYVDRSQLGQLLADKGWTYDPSGLSKSSELNASKKLEQSRRSPKHSPDAGPPYTRRTGTVTDYQDKARK